jgi:hypothetical protein
MTYPSAVRRNVGLPPPLIRADRSEAIEVLPEALVRQSTGTGEGRAEARDSPVVRTSGQTFGRLHEYASAGADDVVFDWPTPADDETLWALAGPTREALRADTTDRAGSSRSTKEQPPSTRG